MRICVILSVMMMAGAALAAPAKPNYVTPVDDAATAMTVLDLGGKSHTIYSESHALVIAQNAYTNWDILPDTEVGAIELRDILEKHRFKVEIYKNLHSNELFSTIDSFFRRKATIPEARIFVYIAGHGFHRLPLHRSEGYFLPVDAPKQGGRPEALEIARFGLSMHHFSAWARFPDPRHMLFVFDFCFSGAFFGQLPADGMPLSQTPAPLNGGSVPVLAPPPRDNRGLESSDYIFQPSTLSKSRQFISAGSEVEVAPKISVFSKLFLQILDGSRAQQISSNLDHWSVAREFGPWLELNTKREYRSGPNPTTPIFGPLRDSDYQRGDFIFARLDLKDNLVVYPNPDPFTPVWQSAEDRATKTQAAVLARAANNEVVEAIEAEKRATNRTAFALQNVRSSLRQNPFAAGRLRNEVNSLERQLAAGQAKVVALEKQAATSQAIRNPVSIEGSSLSVSEFTDLKAARAAMVSIPPPATQPGREYQVSLQKQIDLMSSDDNTVRRQARIDFRTLLKANRIERDAVMPTLLRGLHSKSYRYQIGLTLALQDQEVIASTPHKDMMLFELKSATNRTSDTTLRKHLVAAMATISSLQ